MNRKEIEEILILTDEMEPEPLTPEEEEKAIDELREAERLALSTLMYYELQNVHEEIEMNKAMAEAIKSNKPVCLTPNFNVEYGSMKEGQKAVVKALLSSGVMNCEQLEAETGLSLFKVRKTLKELHDDGVVKPFLEGDELSDVHNRLCFSPMQAFLYEILRDHLPVGVVQKIISDQATKSAWLLTDPDLSVIAKRMTEELEEQGV